MKEAGSSLIVDVKFNFSCSTPIDGFEKHPNPILCQRRITVQYVGNVPIVISCPICETKYEFTAAVSRY